MRPRGSHQGVVVRPLWVPSLLGIDEVDWQIEVIHDKWDRPAIALHDGVAQACETSASGRVPRGGVGLDQSRRPLRDPAS